MPSQVSSSWLLADWLDITWLLMYSQTLKTIAFMIFPFTESFECDGSVSCGSTGHFISKHLCLKIRQIDDVTIWCGWAND